MVTERLNEACYKFCTEITKAALVLLQSWVLAWMMQNTSSKSAKSDFNLFRFSSGGHIKLIIIAHIMDTSSNKYRGIDCRVSYKLGNIW